MDALKRKLGRKHKTADNSSLTAHNKQSWDAQQQHQLQHQQQTQLRRRLEEGTAITSMIKGDSKSQRVHAQAQTQPAPADWFTAAMQNSAQLSNMAAAPPQEDVPQKGNSPTKTPEARKLVSKQRQAQLEGEEPESPSRTQDKNNDWFEQAIQQSSQLSQMG